ncbi:MAG: MupA/Atu3671 family FMN-dependent luciferase-like monooxygenase, partial [Bacteroidota bacterium]
VIYTSGTTGGPKGVMVEHRQLHHFVHAYQLAPSKSSLTCNVIFDVSVMEIFSNLLSGSCLFIPPRDLVFSPDDYADFLDQNQISHCYLHPMHLEAIAAALAQKEQLYLQRILIGVEPIKVAAIQWYLQKGIEVHNAYGPTECTICATAFVVNGHALSERVNLPIGRPMVNTKVYLLDANLQAVGTGIPGKLYIAGSGLSRGYLKRLELTKEKFIANPFEEGGLMYDSGDVAKWWPDGLIEFMGRKDAQMKIRGHRIEAGEIEKAILNFAPEVQQALVLVKTVNQEQVLVSYYTTTESLEKAQLRQYLLEQLPAYMVPTYYVRLDDFPLTSNGKIDRKALPAPISLDLIRQVYRAPRNRTEQVLVDIWQSLLKIDQVGIDDNFFELGGHSLLIGNVLHQLKAQLGKTLPFKTFFTHSTVASLVAQLQLEAQSSILPAAKGDHYPLTSTQFRFWLLCQLEEINSAYNIPFTIRMKGPLKVETLEKAIQYLLRRHESLRTYFVQSKSNEVRQSSLPAESLTFQLAVQELTPQQDLYACIEAFNKRPFDLTKAPLFAAQLIPLSESEHCLCLNVHHLVSDGWSLQVLIEELASVYNSLLNQVPIDLPQLTIQFKDYACWMESNLGTAYQENEKFWLNELAGELPILNLPTYQARPPVQTYHGSSITHQWTDSLVQRIKTFSGEQRTTVFMTLIAGLNAFLHRYTQQEDIILGTPVAGRSYPELEKQIGLYINTLPIRTRFSGADNFYQLLARQKDILLKVYAHADYPFGELVNQLQLNRDTSRSPIFDVLVTHQKQSAQSWELKNAIEGLECGAYEKVESSVSKFDLTFSFTESDQSIYLDVEYNTDLYQGAFIQQLIRHFTCFLQQCLDLPSLPIRKMEYLEAQELDQLLHGFNQTLVDYTIDQTFVQAFATQVERHPERIALICEGEQISYLDLSQRSNQLAFHLQSLGISTSSIVGLCIGRSIDLLVGILAILKAGATYLPLDPFYPIDRIDYILEHSQTDFVLVDSMSQGILPRTVQAINLDQKDIWTAATLFETPEINAHSMAYVIYTSGSTGRPKGVKVTHRNLMNFLVGMNDQFAFQEEVATWLAVTSISFDISILELLWTLSRGDQIVLDLEKPVVLHPKPQMDFSLFYFPTKQENTATEDKYQLLIEGAKFADQHGFEALWVPERHFHNFGDQFPNPSVAAAAVSTITQQVKLRSGSVVLPLHDPVRVAEEWSMIDHLSKGRVELSIASGWHPNDFVLAPNDYKNRHQLMREKIQTLRSLWRGAALTRKNGVGEDFEFFIHPRPVQAELPIWITAAGSIDTFKYAGSIGGNILTHLLGQSIEDLIEKIKAYRLARKENGFDPEEGKVALMLHTFVGDDPEFVKEVVEQPFKNYLRNSFNLLKPMAEEQGLDFEKDMDVILEMGFLRFYKTGSLFGTPETCLELIQKLFKSGINEIACLIDFGVEEALVIDHFYHLDRLKELVRRAKNQFDYIRGRMQLHDERQSTTALIQEYAISHLQSTPSFYEELLSHEEGRKSIRQLQTLLVGGEALKPALAQKLLALDQSCIYNMYGPTETTIWSAVKKVEDEMVTIGRPIANTQIYILDQAQQICPIGIVGELCIGGDGVSSGYLHRSDLTDERFIPNPFIEGEKIYRTGDLACWLPNGELQFLGRLDSQVKIRGHRIELSEIEAVCLSLTGVNQCVVTTATVNQQVVLIAYLQADENHQETQVKDHLRLRLPHYMIPQYVQFLKDFPKTPNGKVDTKRLPQPGAEQMLSRSFVAPKNQTEEALSQLWADSLQLEKVSVNDNYFEIGGNSMKAFQLLASINTTLEVDLKIISFFQYPTVRTLSDHLRQAEKEQLVLVEDEMENVDDLLDFMSDL